MTTPSASHIVLIPSYNPGPQVTATVAAARQAWEPVWLVVDGSTDGTPETLTRLAVDDPGLRVLVLPRNQGKGAAVLHGLERALAEGYTHALIMDSDGQHPADFIPAFMAASRDRPEAMILGVPAFDADAPALRVKGRKISNFWANFETLWTGIADSLFGFRVYPMAPLVSVMRASRWMRRFDFDPEVVVRLRWRGVPAINLGAPVRYPSAEAGGISHFRYVRDNILLTWMHLRLLAEFLFRLPRLLGRRLSGRP